MSRHRKKSKKREKEGKKKKRKSKQTGTDPKRHNMMNETMFPFIEQMSLKKRLTIEPLLPPKDSTVQTLSLSPLSAVQRQAKRAKSNQQLRADERAATVASMRNDTRPEELRWARGLSGLNVSYPCKVLTEKAKQGLNTNTRTMLHNEDLIDKVLVCFFVGNQLYFSAVPDHDSLPFFIPGDTAYIAGCAQPDQMKTKSRTVKRLLAQLTGVVAMFDTLYQEATSMVAAEALLSQVHNNRMKQYALDIEQRNAVKTQMRLEALFASEPQVELDMPYSHYLTTGDIIIFNNDTNRAKVLQLIEKEESRFVQIGVAKSRYLLNNVSIRRVIPSVEAEEILGDVFNSDVEYVTPICLGSSFRFVVWEDRTFAKKCMNQVQKFMSNCSSLS